MASKATEVKWIAIALGIFDDEKIKLIEAMPEGDTMLVIWLKLLVLAGKCNSEGVLLINDRIAYTDEMLATIFRRPLTVVRMALDVFKNLGMIEIIEQAVTIPNWSKYQQIETTEQIKANNAERQKRFRERQKIKALGLPEASGEPDTDAERNVTRNVTHNVTGNAEVTPYNNNNNNNNNSNNNNSVSKADLEREFEALWKIYPRKQGKQDALKAYVSARKKGTTYEEVLNGIENYKAEIARKKTDSNFVKHGSAWFRGHRWEDEYDGGNSNEECTGHTADDYYSADFRQA